MVQSSANASSQRPDVFAWLEEQEHASVGSQEHNEALVVLSKAGDVNGCVRIVQRMVALGIKVHRTTMNSVIAACAKAGDGAAAEAWWRRMQDVGHSPNRATYGSVIHAWVKAGNLPKAEEWLMAMHDAGFAPPKGFSRPIAYILLGEALSASSGESDVPEVDHNQADFATEWLLRFRALGMYLDRSTMNLLMSVYARHGDADKAENWVYHMNQAGIQPNQSTFNALVLANTRADRLDAACGWMREMHQLGFETPSDQMIQEHFPRGNSSIPAPSSSSLVPPIVHENFQRGTEAALPSHQRPQGNSWASDLPVPHESSSAKGNSRSPRVEGLSMTVLPRTGAGWDMASFASDVPDLRTSRNAPASVYQNHSHPIQASTSHAADAEYLSQPIAAGASRGGGKQGHVSRKGKGKGKIHQFADRDGWRGSSGKEHREACGGKGHQRGARSNVGNFAQKPHSKNGKGGKHKSAGKVGEAAEASFYANSDSPFSYAGDIEGAIGRIPVPMGLVDSNVPSCNFFFRQSL